MLNDSPTLNDATKQLIEERVRRGGEWLDTQKPGWYYLIDLGGLDLGCGKNCILGQLWASEALTLAASVGYGQWNGFGTAIKDMPDSTRFVVEHGFLRAYDNYTNENLDVAWIAYIKERINNA